MSRPKKSTWETWEKRQQSNVKIRNGRRKSLEYCTQTSSTSQFVVFTCVIKMKIYTVISPQKLLHKTKDIPLKAFPFISLKYDRL